MIDPISIVWTPSLHLFYLLCKCIFRGGSVFLLCEIRTELDLNIPLFIYHLPRAPRVMHTLSLFQIMFELALESDVIMDACITNIPMPSAGNETEHSFHLQRQTHTCIHCPFVHHIMREFAWLIKNLYFSFFILVSVSCILSTKGDMTWELMYVS